MWSWLGYMNPHRLTWGSSYSMNYAQMVALATLPGVLITPDRSSLPKTRETYLLATLWFFYTMSTIFSLFPELSWPQWERVSKILLFTFLTLLFFQDKKRLRILLLIIALSIGFYGLKGGFFALRTGGQFQVVFPEDTMMGENTGFGLAINMILPICFFLAREEQNPWLRRLLRTVFLLSIPAVVATYSRGAALGLGAVLFWLSLKTKRKHLAIAAIVIGGFLVLAYSPEKWIARMETLLRYQEDASAMGRIKAWMVFSRVGFDRPLFGAGFWSPATDEITFRYNPEASKSRDAHSIFFNILGEHGPIALGAFVGLIICCFLTLRSVRKDSQAGKLARWVQNYSNMLEVSLVGYVVTGTFLSVSYVDLFYQIVAFTVLLKVVAEKEASEGSLHSRVAPVISGASG